MSAKGGDHDLRFCLAELPRHARPRVGAVKRSVVADGGP